MPDSAHSDGAANWSVVTDSLFAWEQEALQFVRAQFPRHEPYRAWSNFEFIADDGTINEVDLLVFSPQGFFLIEIKSRPGRLFGDQGTWTWEDAGRFTTVDNPLLLANTKAKRLRSLLNRQRCVKNAKLGRDGIPFLDAMVFCSAPDLRLELSDAARYRVCLRDREQPGVPARAGVMAAILRRECPGLQQNPRGTYDRPTSKLVSRALDELGIKARKRERKIGDLRLTKLIEQGTGYQDWQAEHPRLTHARRRVRIYPVSREGGVHPSEEARQIAMRAAEREASLLESLEHPGVLRYYSFHDSEYGFALVLDDPPSAVRLDHFLSRLEGGLPVGVQLNLLRQIGEAIAYAHERRIVHRALAPQNILVVDQGSGDRRYQIKILNWSVGYRGESASRSGTLAVPATDHVEELVDSAAFAYLAPDLTTKDGSLGEHLDVFSLGALAYHLFSGKPPAASAVELSEKLRGTHGLQISSVLNGANNELQDLIQFSTDPDVSSRLGTARDFLELLEKVEESITAPDSADYVDPVSAKKGDHLSGGFVVESRLGQGSTSIALLVKRGTEYSILKIASDPDQNTRLDDEAAVIEKLRHAHVVEYQGKVFIADRVGILLKPVFADNDRKEKRVETLGHRLRREGRLSLDLLQRFGEDLVETVRWLEELGIPHRDLKPDNIAVGYIGSSNTLHIVLFDFSLARAPLENIKAGTTGYLDPFLPLRKPRRWDLHAERYAAGATLYELATGTLPRWGDGVSDPSMIDCELTLEPELFDPAVREDLTEFFCKALAREPEARFHNAEEMLGDWRRIFSEVDVTGRTSDQEKALLGLPDLSAITLETGIAALGLGAPVVSALDRANILTVGDLLKYPANWVLRIRGLGYRTRRTIRDLQKVLRGRFGVGPERLSPAARGGIPLPVEMTTFDGDHVERPEAASIDLIYERVRKLGTRANETMKRVAPLLFGEDPKLPLRWPSRSEIAEHLELSSGRISQTVLYELAPRWVREPVVAALRELIADLLRGQNGLMTLDELVSAVVRARGGLSEEPELSRRACAVIRVAVEVEGTIAEPKIFERRHLDGAFFAVSPELLPYGSKLGERADKLAKLDPLAAPSRVLQELRNVPLPLECAPFSDARIIKIAAELSDAAALSPRQELYPRGMEASRALKLSQGALVGVRILSPEEVRKRVESRYPEAAPLPARPELDPLIAGLGIGLAYNTATEQYESQARPFNELSSDPSSYSRYSTTTEQPPSVTPEIADTWAFEERLKRSLVDQSFLALTVSPREYLTAASLLTSRFDLQRFNLEEALLLAMHEVARELDIPEWQVVLDADRGPGGEDWENLLMVVDRSLEKVQAQLRELSGPTLLTYPGLIARYDRLKFIEDLRDKTGAKNGYPTLWLLVPSGESAQIDTKPVPLLSSGQRAAVRTEWIKNLHRSNRAQAVS